ncbi:MAG: T9SS type A sorting domain-containing protein, partial [Ignavibacteria bacterium]|nr:T9SS type A sorting domain-containing protein [Ignavibacteria bacterium]
MKKIFILAILLTVWVNLASSQVKVTFSLANKNISAGILSYDVIATVPAGQTWRVGACNIRVNFAENPAGCLTVHIDNPAINANPNISGANGYSNMTTTSVASGAAIGLNILTFYTGACYRFTTGTYTLGKIRFNITTPFAADTMKFRNSPMLFPTVVTDSMTTLVYNTGYSTIDPVITGIEYTTGIPENYELFQNYPNPFNPTTNIKYDVPKASFVKIKVYDMSGKEITTLVNQDMQPGTYEAAFDASKLSSGIYFYKMETKEFNKVMKMVLLK